jgi:hypothetical protein
MWNSIKEGLVLNIISLLISLGSLGMIVWTLLTTQFKAGLDDLFLILTGLFLALVFSISPLRLVTGLLRQKLGRRQTSVPAEQAAPIADKKKAVADQ